MVCALLPPLRTAGQPTPEFFHIDFETLPDGSSTTEGTAISTQYANTGTYGVTFAGLRPDGVTTDPAWLPIIAVEGGTTPAAFVLDNGTADQPMTWGARGLAARVVGGQRGGIVTMFDPPVTSVRLFVVDIDSGAPDTATVTAFNGAAVLDVLTKCHAPAACADMSGTGDGVSTPFSFAAPAITRVQVNLTPTATSVMYPGWALDSLSFTRARSVPYTGPFVRVAQESTSGSPGPADFDANICGVLRPWQAQLTPAGEFYLYDVNGPVTGPSYASWNGFALSPIAERSHLLLGQTTQGLTLFQVHDRPDNADGGHAEVKIGIFGNSGSLSRTVEDGESPRDVFNPPQTGPQGQTIFTSSNDRQPCCTDGQAISGFSGTWSAFVQFSSTCTAPIQGLNSWGAYSSDGVVAPPTLAANRRVQLQPIPACIAVAWPSHSSVSFDGTATLHVTIPGTGPFNYQWRKNGLNLTDVLGHVAGSLTATLTISNASPADAGAYDCLVAGACSVTSNATILAVTDAVDVVAANPPTADGNPFAPGQPYRDVLPNTTTALVGQGIGATGTPAEGSVTYAPISVTFSGTPTPGPATANIVRSCTDIAGNGQGDCPTLTGVSGSGAGPYLIALSGPLPVRECITFTFAGTNPGQKLQYQSLPGDMNLNGTTSGQDVLALVMAINSGCASQPGNEARYDINRNGSVSGQDVIRLVQLINGGATVSPYTGYNNAMVAACP